jgi:hypothetical protein
MTTRLPDGSSLVTAGRILSADSIIPEEQTDISGRRYGG